MTRGRSGLWAWVCAGVLAAALAVGLAACGDDDTAAGRPDIVVTTTVLGSLVTELVGDEADVEVLMPNGADPHDFQPSAKDVEAIGSADLVVQNGLDLEEGLEDALGQARDDGVPTFTATDHVTLRVRGAGEPEHAEEEHEGEGEEEEHGPEDPHIWMDPLAMRSVVASLTPVVADALGLDVSERGRRLEARLRGLDGEISAQVARIPEARRRLVTGHESMGYFADRYGFELVGALLPSLSSQAEPSASALAALREQIEREGVPVIFDELGTPEGLADAIADETGARVVEIGSHTLPEDRSYFTFMTEVRDIVVGALVGAPGS